MTGEDGGGGGGAARGCPRWTRLQSKGAAGDLIGGSAAADALRGDGGDTGDAGGGGAAIEIGRRTRRWRRSGRAGRGWTRGGLISF